MDSAEKLSKTSLENREEDAVEADAVEADAVEADAVETDQGQWTCSLIQFCAARWWTG